MTRSDRVLVAPLGESARAEVAAAVRRQFRDRALEWFDRNSLRRAPLSTLAGLLTTRYADAVLVVPDRRQPRLRLTSFVLTLVRADRYWRIDLRDACEPCERFSRTRHAAQNALPIARHLAACAVAALAAEPLLHLVRTLSRPAPAQRTPANPRRIPRMPAAAHRSGSPRQRILYLRSQLWLGLSGGGSVAHTAGVIGGLQRAGAMVHVVSSDTLNGVSAPTTVAMPEVWFDEPLRELEDLAYNVPFFLTAQNAVHRFPPTAIYQRHTAFNIAGALLARLLRVPLILEFNSSELWKGHYWGGLHRRRAAELVERINVRAATRIVVVSRVLRDQLVAQGVPCERVLINPNAVDPEQFRPDIDGTRIRQRHGIPDDAVVVGFSGTFGLWHGIPTLAQALPLADGVHWLLVGDGPLRHLIKAEEQANVTLTGLVPHGEMPAYLAACDILVSPHGRQADGGEFFGSPTKLYEYMAMGRPIVASAVGQIADVLEDGRSALLVPPDDPTALAAALARLVTEPELRQRLGDRARQDALDHHTWRQNAERVLATLEQ